MKFMARKQHSIDGFRIPRRARPRQDVGVPQSVPAHLLKDTEQEMVPPQIVTRRDDKKEGALRRSDIDESLKKFDDEPFHRKKRWRPSKKFFKRLVVIVLIIGVLIGGYLGFKAIMAGMKIFGGNIFDIVSQAKPLKEDENGRSNILIFGTSEDDPNEHDGATLTDSIMIVSVDQDKKVAAITSVPRDLWVEYDTDCIAGYQGKINVVYQCAGGGDDADIEKGAAALRKKIGEVYGLDIQYSVKVGYQAVQQAVDAVGGVDVVIESDDPRGILDRNFDWECNFKCYYVKYPNGPAHLDGKHALMLARARNDAGGYGLSRGNFDREINQQKILVALRQKAASAGTLANPVAASKLIDAIGDNVRTNFDSGEIRTLINLARDTKESSIDRFSLVDEEPALLTTGMVSGQSVVKPVAGLMDYSDIQAYIRKRLTMDEATKENATITVLNGSGRVGAAAEMQDTLTTKGFNVVEAGNAAESAEYGKVAIYKLSTTKQPATAKKLATVLKAKVKTSALPYGMTSTSDFVVIVGQ
jgi:polyisoprenyl-teichoic acid--peptidoglycan teichoic acid transferase